MRLDRRIPVVALAALAAALVAASCPGTLAYRDIQADFEDAVRADNEAALGQNPLLDRSPLLYADVVAELSDERIAGLEPKLRANAWMLRAYAAWRIGELSEARSSAERGRGEAGLVAHSRDDVLLHLMPALVADSEAMAGFLAAGRRASADEYERVYAPAFALALRKVGEAEARRGNPTPESVGYYLAYERWRILRNWNEVVSGLATADERNAARGRARELLGATLDDAATTAARAIPSDHPLARLIRRIEG